MNTSRYDVCILGSGPAGYAAALRAHDLGRRALLVERGRVGGAGIHEGALSSKTFWHLAYDYSRTARTDRGYRFEGVSLSYADVMATVRAAVAERRATLEGQLATLARVAPHAPHDGHDGRAGSITLERGVGRLLDAHTVEVSRDGADPRRFEADHLVIATGSMPRRLDGIEIDGQRIVTSDHIEAWGDFPRSMVIVGAGVVGCEYATIFASFGRTKIHIIDRQPRILPFEDDDVAAIVARNFEAMGVVIHRESKLESLKAVEDGVEYVISSPRGRETIHVERALISVGRVPNTAGLGLESVGVAVAKNGSVEAADTRTTVANIYAVGDTTADVALVNIAELEGRHAVEKMFGLDPRPIPYEALSSIMFLKPEVASVGLNELQAKQKGVRYRVAVVHNALVNRCLAMRATDGFVKLLASPEGKILGLRVVGPQASTCIQGTAFLIELGATLEDIDRCVHPHPAITEGVQECARLLLGRSLHKVDAFGPELLRVGEG